MRVVVGRRQLEHRAELRLGLLPAVDAEVRDAERLADRGLLGLAALRLLERDRRLRGVAVLQVRLPLLEEVVGLVSSLIEVRKVLSNQVYRMRQVARSRDDRRREPPLGARPNASASSNGGPGRSSRSGTSSAPRPQSGTPVRLVRIGERRCDARIERRLAAARGDRPPARRPTPRRTTSNVPPAKTWSAPVTSAGACAPAGERAAHGVGGTVRRAAGGRSVMRERRTPSRRRAAPRPARRGGP